MNRLLLIRLHRLSCICQYQVPVNWLNETSHCDRSLKTWTSVTGTKSEVVRLLWYPQPCYALEAVFLSLNTDIYIILNGILTVALWSLNISSLKWNSMNNILGFACIRLLDILYDICFHQVKTRGKREDGKRDNL